MFERLVCLLARSSFKGECYLGMLVPHPLHAVHVYLVLCVFS